MNFADKIRILLCLVALSFSTNAHAQNIHYWHGGVATTILNVDSLELLYDSTSWQPNNYINVWKEGYSSEYSQVDSITFPKSPKEKSLFVKGNVYDANFTGYKVSTIAGESVIEEDGVFNNVPSLYGDSCIQTFFLNDGENVFMLARKKIDRWNNEIQFDARSTAIALAAFHPLFAPERTEYNEVENVISRDKYFDDLVKEVEQSIHAKRNLFDQTNVNLLTALENLLNDLSSTALEANEQQLAKPAILRSPANKETKTYKNKYYPLYVQINSDNVVIRNTRLTPSYYGTVTHNGVIDKIAIPTRGDYGVLDIFKLENEIHLGPEVEYNFKEEGDYVFDLSRMSDAAQNDYILQLANYAFSIIGFSDVYKEDINMLARRLKNTLYTSDGEIVDWDEWRSIFYKEIFDYIKQKTSQENILKNINLASKFIMSSLDLYDKIKGTANIVGRIVFGFSAPKYVNFTIHYDAENRNAEPNLPFSFTLTKESGDEQVSNVGETLPLPLVIKATRHGEQTSIFDNYLQVNYYVEGEGKLDRESTKLNDNNKTSVVWTVGYRKEQKVYAYISNSMTGESVSDTVCFTASLIKKPLCPDGNHPHMIDMGIYTYVREEGTYKAHKVLWSCCNVGATKPEEYGNFYAWGETKTKEKYTQDNYLSWSKYSTDDTHSRLLPEDDAATANWGEQWRLPTNDEMEYLCKEPLYWSWDSINGVNGYRIEASNGNAIFLPAAGAWYETIYDGPTYVHSGIYARGIFGRYLIGTVCKEANGVEYTMSFSKDRLPTVFYTGDEGNGESARPVHFVE